jgi:hypothetical protein
MVMTTAEKLLVEGETKAWRKAVLLALRSRFGNVTAEVETAINQKNDPIVLESLAVRVEHCNSLEEFADGL